MQTVVQNPPLVNAYIVHLYENEKILGALQSILLADCLWRVWPLLLLSSYINVCNGQADGRQETNGHKYFLLFLLTEGQLRETESRAQAGRVKT